MRLRSTVLSTAAVLLGGGLGTTTAQAAPPAATVSGVEIAGSGPGDLVRAMGTGFTPGSAVTAVVVSGGRTLPLARAVADGAGSVTLPAGARVPVTAAPGSIQVTMTGADGVTATRSTTLAEPSLLPDSFYQPGEPRAQIYLRGLATTPEVVRTLRIDGTVVESTWYRDERSFAFAGLFADMPSTLAPGEHSVRFTQIGATPYDVTSRFRVAELYLAVQNHVAPRDRVGIRANNTAYDDVVDLTVVGADGDRHTGLRFLHTPTSTGYTETSQVELDGVSAGPARMTGVSRRNGATATAVFTVDPATVTPPAGLASGERVVSADGIMEVRMQSDGNLVQRSYGRYVEWSTRTAGHVGARLTVQADGNVVLRGADGRALWTTGTAGIGARARFGFDDADEPTVFAATGRRAWSSFTPYGGDLLERLTANAYLHKGQSVTANLLNRPGGAVYLTMGGDGDLVVRADHAGALWSTRTAGHPNAYLTLQTDGNLVLRAPNGAALWANGVRGTPGATLAAQGDGNVVERDARGRAVWSTGTHVP